MSTPPAPSESTATYVVELTPPGRGAVAVLLVAGPEAVRGVGECFVANSRRPLTDVPLNRIVVGRWGGSEGEELVVCRRSDDEVEVHCHGGLAAVRAVIDTLIAKGCREIAWREWLHRCSRVSPKLGIASRPATSSPRPARGLSMSKAVESRDATTCDAQIALADAVTLRAATILVDQLNGALSRAIHAILDAIAAGDWDRAAELVDELSCWREVGLHLTTPWRVVFAGPPNVGKSSLMNALAGYERAIVSPEPGTTRDVVTLTTAIDGWPVQLADTAGLRPTTDEIESAGVALAETALANADLAVMVADATQTARYLFSSPGLMAGRVLYVRNKIDLLPAAGAESDAVRSPTIGTSALTGAGIAELAIAIGKTLVPNPPPPGTAVPFTAGQVESLAVARYAIVRQHAAAAIEALQAMLAAVEG